MIYSFDFTEGCVCFSYLINGVEYVDTPSVKIKKALIALINHSHNLSCIIDIISSLDNEFSKNDILDKYPNIRYIINTMNVYDDAEALSEAKECLFEFIEKYFPDYEWQMDIIRLVQLDMDTVTDYSDKPCDCCGDYIINYKLEI